MAMRCPSCGGRGYVKDTRTRKDNSLTRRYHCSGKGCKAKWTSSEFLVTLDAEGRGTVGGNGSVGKILSERLRKGVQDDMRRQLRVLLGFQK